MERRSVIDETILGEGQIEPFDWEDTVRVMAGKSICKEEKKAR